MITHEDRESPLGVQCSKVLSDIKSTNVGSFSDPRDTGQLDILIGFAKQLTADRDAIKLQMERAFQMLEACGVPRERAKTVSNGIDVLSARCHKEAVGLTADSDAWKTKAERYAFRNLQLVEASKAYMSKYGPGYSTTDSLAYDNLRGVLDAIAALQKGTL